MLLTFEFKILMLSSKILITLPLIFAISLLHKWKQNLLIIHPEHVVRINHLGLKHNRLIIFRTIQYLHSLFYSQISRAEPVLHNEFMKDAILQKLKPLQVASEGDNLDLP